MKIILSRLFVIVFGSLSLVGLPALAQTPDGDTPANEGVCDGLVGMTPGLYGLCVAFCEAQDAQATLDPATGQVTFAEGFEPPNPKLLDIYNRKRRSDDPPMPCVNVAQNECPCWTEEELQGLGDGATVVSCSGNYLSSDNPFTGYTEGAETFQLADGQRGCTYWEGSEEDEMIRTFEIDETDLAVCSAQIQQECDRRGWPAF